MPISRKPHPEFKAPVKESQLITSVRIAPKLHARFEAYAAQHKLSKSAAINRLLEEMLPK